MAIDFVDRSGKGHVPTNSGVSSDSGQSVFNNRSGYFDGASYVSYPDSDNFDFGTDDFTIDFWLNFSTVQDSDFVGTGYDIGFLVHYSASNIYFYAESVAKTASWTPSTGVWYHVAVCRNDGMLNIFVDGISLTNTAASEDIQSTSSLQIGKDVTASNYFHGYIDGLRIHKGKSLWTENFIPPNAPVEQVDEETVLLLHCDGVNASTTFTDGGVHQHTVTANADAQVSTTESKFGGASLYLDGTGDYLSIPDSTYWDLGSEEFCIDCWIKRGAGSGSTRVIVARWDYSAGDYRCWGLQLNTSNQIVGYVSTNGTDGGATTVTGTTVLDTSWHHLAFLRIANTLYVYLDGVFENSESFSSSVYDSNRSIFIGANNAGGDNLYDGYIDEFRISKGIGRWTEDFIPPVEPYPAYDVPVTVRDETVLLLHGDGADASTTFDNYGITDHSITVNSNAQISTTQSKFGGSSIKINGGSDSLELGDLSDFDIATGDFTIDCWGYLTSYTNNPTICGKYQNDGTGYYWRVLESGYITFNADTNTELLNSSTTQFPLNQWAHVALVRHGDYLAIYLDGVVVTSTTFVGSLIDGVADFYVGRFYPSINASWNGYLDEFRFTKGKALWTGEFTPPTAPYPDIKDADTKLLIHAESLATKDGYTSDLYIKDSSESNHNIFLNGDATLSSTESKFGSKSIYFDGTGDYLTLPDSSDWAFSTGDFTVDLWVNFDSLASQRGIIGQYHTSTPDDYRWQIIWYSNTVQFYAKDGTVMANYTFAWTPTLDTYYHLSLVREGTSIYIFVDGVSQSLTVNTAISTTAMPDVGGDLSIGRGRSGAAWIYNSGFNDEIRISKGIARWTANFTPPAAPYPDYM